MAQLEKIDEFLPDYKDMKVYGAVAYLKAEEESEIFAERQHLFVIRATGNSAAIVNNAYFVPRIF